MVSPEDVSSRIIRNLTTPPALRKTSDAWLWLNPEISTPLTAKILSPACNRPSVCAALPGYTSCTTTHPSTVSAPPAIDRPSPELPKIQIILSLIYSSKNQNFNQKFEQKNNFSKFQPKFEKKTIFQNFSKKFEKKTYLQNLKKKNIFSKLQPKHFFFKF